MNCALIKIGFDSSRDRGWSRSNSIKRDKSVSNSGGNVRSWSGSKSRGWATYESMSGSWNKNLGMIQGKTKSSSRDKFLS